MTSRLLGSESMSRCISASDDATPFSVGVVEGEAHAEHELPWKLLPALAASRAGSAWPPRWNRNAVILSTLAPSSTLRPRNGPLATWRTLTMTAASPGHWTRLVAR